MHYIIVVKPASVFLFFLFILYSDEEITTLAEVFVASFYLQYLLAVFSV